MKLIILVIAMVALTAWPAQAQDKTKVDPAKYAETVDTPPEIVGGMKALAEKIVYPPEAKEAGVEGMVFLRLLIGKDGRVDDVSVEKSDSAQLNDAAITAAKGIRFTPGKVDGVAVCTKVMLPVKFKLQ